MLNNHFQSFWYLIELSRDLELAAITPKWENANKIVIFAREGLEWVRRAWDCCGETRVGIQGQGIVWGQG